MLKRQMDFLRADRLGLSLALWEWAGASTDIATTYFRDANLSLLCR